MPELGKYGAEVLSAYAVSIAMILVMVVVYLRNARAARRTLEELEARKDG